jgi:hypothetical protein
VSLRCASQAYETIINAAFEISSVQVRDGRVEHGSFAHGLEVTSTTDWELRGSKALAARRPEAEDSMPIWVAVDCVEWCGLLASAVCS